jgi:hypothetical protein
MTKLIVLAAALALGLVAGISIITIHSPQAAADCTSLDC